MSYLSCIKRGSPTRRASKHVALAGGPGAADAPAPLALHRPLEAVGKTRHPELRKSAAVHHAAIPQSLARGDAPQLFVDLVLV